MYTTVNTQMSTHQIFQVSIHIRHQLKISQKLLIRFCRYFSVSKWVKHNLLLKLSY